MAHVQNTYSGLWKPEDLSVDKISSQKMFKDNTDALNTFILSEKSKIGNTVNTLAELRAVNTTDTTLYPDNKLVFVALCGWYYLDRDSTSLDNNTTIITPTTGGGRWIKEFVSPVTLTPTIGIGMNSVIRKSDGIESFPKFSMTGKSYVNLLGKDGNCESTTPFQSIVGCTTSLDSTNKVFGANSMKFTLTASVGSMWKALTHIFSGFDTSKYYLMSAYLKNGNAGFVVLQKDTTSGGVAKSSTQVTDTTKFTRVCFKCQPSDLNVNNNVSIYISGSTGQYVYLDGLMINEISASDYALTDQQLMDKYPYVDSYACLQNPYIEVRHDNLVRNGNGEEGLGWWSWNNGGSPDLPLFSGGYFVVTDSSTTITFYKQLVKIKESTSYSYRVVAKKGTGVARFSINGSDANGNLIDIFLVNVTTTNTTDTVLSGTVTPSAGVVTLDLYLISSQTAADTGICYFKEVMVVEGSTIPTSYKPCRIERCIIEGKFTSDDSFTYENGEVTGLLNWKHKTLFGKDFDWQYFNDFTGFKELRMPQIVGMQNTATTGYTTTIKHDGKILSGADASGGADRAGTWNDGYFYLSIADTDSGFAESVNPNADEVKAFMNGWKAIYNNGTRYLTFISVLDGSAPSGALKTAVTSATTGTTINVTAGTGTQYTANDVISIVRNGVYISSVTVSSVTANTVVVNVSSTVAVGDVIIKADTASSTPLLTYCKNNIAPGYEGYQLHYKLANPEPITDVNVHIHGDIPKFDTGDNYLYLGYGVVLGEVANPAISATHALINSTDYIAGLLRNKAEVISSVIRNGVFDNVWTIDTVNAYGNQRSYTLLANYDTNATYTVDYQILKTTHTTPTVITTSYQQDVLNAIADLAEILENKQNHDSALDTLVDLSMYESVRVYGATGKPVLLLSQAYIHVWIPFKVDKAAIPTIKISELKIERGDSGGAMIDVTSSFKLYSMVIQRGYVVLRFNCPDATVSTAVNTYGYLIYTTVNADCRGKV